MKESNISTLLIQDGLNYYSRIGYQMVNVPIVIDKDISARTKPEFVQDLHHNEKVYIGSAEQGLLQLNKNGFLNKNGNYMAITPCFRNETVLDESHFLIFLKIELMIITDTPEIELKNMINDALSFFKFYKKDIECIKLGKNEFDIIVNNTEIGSYGIRNLNKDKKYVYGTGLAEPRFSYALSVD